MPGKSTKTEEEKMALRHQYLEHRRSVLSRQVSRFSQGWFIDSDKWKKVIKSIKDLQNAENQENQENQANQDEYAAKVKAVWQAAQTYRRAKEEKREQLSQKGKNLSRAEEAKLGVAKNVMRWAELQAEVLGLDSKEFIYTDHAGKKHQPAVWDGKMDQRLEEYENRSNNQEFDIFANLKRKVEFSAGTAPRRRQRGGGSGYGMIRPGGIRLRLGRIVHWPTPREMLSLYSSLTSGKDYKELGCALRSQMSDMDRYCEDPLDEDARDRYLESKKKVIELARGYKTRKDSKPDKKYSVAEKKKIGYAKILIAMGVVEKELDQLVDPGKSECHQHARDMFWSTQRMMMDIEDVSFSWWYGKWFLSQPFKDFREAAAAYQDIMLDMILDPQSVDPEKYAKAYNTLRNTAQAYLEKKLGKDKAKQFLDQNLPEQELENLLEKTITQQKLDDPSETKVRMMVDLLRNAPNLDLTKPIVQLNGAPGNVHTSNSKNGLN